MDKHGNYFNDKWKKSPFVLSVYGMLGTGGYICIHNLESTHGGKNIGTHLTRTWLGQRPDCNCGYKVVLTHDPRRSPPKSPTGPRVVLGLRIEPRIGTINSVPE